MKYRINFNTGVEDEFARTLNEAKAIALEGAAYTQQDITIHDIKTNEVVSRLPWYGYPHSEEDGEALVRFGDFGFYSTFADV